MQETNGQIPPRPRDEPAEGYLWVYDYQKGRWVEQEAEIRSADEPFFTPGNPDDGPDLVTPE